MTLLLHRSADLPAPLRGGVWCIGNFDGVHRGHQLMLETGRKIAADSGRPFAIMTFHPHPLRVLAPNRPLQLLTTDGQRRRLLEAFSPAVLLTVEPTREFLHLSPETFLADILQRDLGVSHIVEGQNFTYGRAAAGTIHTLLQQAPAHGFAATTVPTRDVALSDATLLPVSSSRIRTLLSLGRVDDAALCLGRPYAIVGAVVHGAQRGRAIGFPTINLETAQLIPGPGVYAGTAAIAGETHVAAISIGTNPTFGETRITLEAHLLNFSRDVYGQSCELAFHRWLRDTLTFSGAGPLVRQIARDVAATAAWFAPPPTPQEIPA